MSHSHPRESDKKAVGEEEKKGQETVENFIPQTKAFVVQLFERALEVRSRFKALSFTKISNLKQLKKSAEQLETPTSVEALAHEIEIKIAEWEKNRKRSYKDVIEGKKVKGKETFGRAQNESKQDTYIKFLSLANDKLTTARISLINMKLEELSTPEARADFIDAKVAEYKAEIRIILARKGEVISLPEDERSVSFFKRQFPRKIVDEARVDEYFESSPYGIYLRKLQLQVSQLISESAVQAEQAPVARRDSSASLFTHDGSATLPEEESELDSRPRLGSNGHSDR